jgi:hypothetical protein
MREETNMRDEDGVRKETNRSSILIVLRLVGHDFLSSPVK